MKAAWLFPGQGAEEAAMGLALADASPYARDLLDRAGGAAGVDLPRLLARGGRRLRDTDVLQPALTAVSLGAAHALRALGQAPSVVAGHSLGEIAAWAAAGGVGDADAVAVAALRGASMARASAARPGGMVAFEGLDRPALDAVLAAVPAGGQAVIAARNGADLWAVSADAAALPWLCAAGGRPLPASGPWHHPAMADAVAPLAQAMAAVARPLTATLLSNADGAPVPDGAALPELLARQLVEPVAWYETMQALARVGVTDVVVLGPGRQLAALARRALGPEIPIHLASDPASIALTAGALRP